VVPVSQGQAAPQKKTEKSELSFRGDGHANAPRPVLTKEPEQILQPSLPPDEPPLQEDRPPMPELSQESAPGVQQTTEVVEPQTDQVEVAKDENRKVVVELRQRDVVRDWASFITYVKERKPWMAQTLRLCDKPHLEGDKLLFRFDNPADCTLLSQRENLQALTTYAQDFFQTELCLEICSLECEVNDGDGPSPREERRALAADPLVQMVTEIFDGKVVGIRTGPKFR
jgi:DNA polymerase-3 subunit gamma/tau